MNTIPNYIDENENKKIKKLMNLALNAGVLLSTYGAESYRAEDTIERICRTNKNVSNVNAYALPSAIFLSLNYKGENYTIFKKVTLSDTNLQNIDKINTLSRLFVKNEININDSMDILDEIKNEKPSKIFIYLSAGIATSFFTILFGGSMKDFLPSFLIGIAISILSSSLLKLKLSFFVNNIICAFISAGLAIICVKFHFGESIDMIIIGAIMLLVPGVQITNAVRDIMSGEFITGTITSIKAVFIALAIALGVGGGLKLFRGIL